MRKIFTSLLLAATVFGSQVAKAQYSAPITSDPENNYFSGQVDFNPEDVATTLGTDTAALHKLIDAGGNVYLKTETGRSNSYTGGTNEFWMNASGVAQGYSAEGSCWFSGLYYVNADEENPSAVVRVRVGQMPKFFAKIYEDSNLSCTLYLVSGEKDASFDVSLHVNAAVKPNEMAEPTHDFASLNVVKEYSASLDFIEGKQYEGKTLTVDLAGIEEALGVDSTTIKGNLENILLTRNVDEYADGTSYEFGSAVNTIGSYNTDGWFGRYSKYDEVADKSETYAQNGPRAYGKDCTFYLQNFALSQTTLTATYGQYPSTMKPGDQDYVELFIVNDTKAVKITLTVNVEPQPTVNFTDMTKAGEVEIEISDKINSQYETKSFTIDMNAVCEALECSIDDISDVFAFSEENVLSDNHTEGSGGYYFNPDGFIGSWGGDATFFIVKSSLAEGKYAIGQHSNKFADITEDTTLTTWLVFMKGDKYYLVTVAYTVKAPTGEEQEAKGPENLVASDVVTMEIIPNNEGVWAWETTSAIDTDYLKEKLGTEDYVLYTVKAKTENEETTLEYSKTYTCDPKPGFWFGTTTYENADKQVIVDNAGWGTNSFGITYADGIITWYQYPGQREIGDNYVAHIYFVNEATGDYVRYILNVAYVGSTTEVIGGEDVAYMLDRESDEHDFVIDGEAEARILKAFDATSVNELFETATIAVANSTGTFVPAVIGDPVFFNEKGYKVEPEDPTAVSQVSFLIEGGKMMFTSDTVSDDDIPVGAKATFAICNAGKRYTLNIRFTDETDAIVTVVDADATVKAIYNVSGVKQSNLRSGINIVKMADGTVRKVMK
ncbi:MAG: DUF4859 domain-containing protein [Bacteroidaceae bacterium]|nr:DUF4859 domain-containing protein [Bacteroidaceae bacterium]